MRSSFKDAFEAGDLMILDGGTGTELERRGVSMHEEAWSAAAGLTHPEVLTSIHADVITTKTYAAQALSWMALAGLAWIGGSISGIVPALARRAVLQPARRPRVSTRPPESSLVRATT